MSRVTTDCQDAPPQVQRPGSGFGRSTNGASADSAVQAFRVRHGCRSRDVASNCGIRLKHQERCEVSSASVIVNVRAIERDDAWGRPRWFCSGHCRFATLPEAAANTAATHGDDADERGAA